LARIVDATGVALARLADRGVVKRDSGELIERIDARLAKLASRVVSTIVADATASEGETIRVCIVRRVVVAARCMVVAVACDAGICVCGVTSRPGLVIRERGARIAVSSNGVMCALADLVATGSCVPARAGMAVAEAATGNEKLVELNGQCCGGGEKAEPDA